MYVITTVHRTLAHTVCLLACLLSVLLRSLGGGVLLVRLDLDIYGYGYVSPLHGTFGGYLSGFFGDFLYIIYLVDF